MQSDMAVLKNSEEHWQKVYGTQQPDSVSWYAPRLELSLAYIEKLSIPRAAACIDIGGGASTLADDLLASGYQDITVLDISENALSTMRRRLGDSASKIQWIQGDITRVDLPQAKYALWHDRAVLHFLVASKDRRAYVETLTRSLAPGGAAVIATFGPEGPTMCSDLPTRRYDAERLQELLGPAFFLVESSLAIHSTPFDTKQQFLYACFRKL